MAAGVMATTAPWASASVLERMTVMRPLPSSQRCTSPQVSAAASERRNPASDSTATRARSNLARCSLLGCFEAAAALAGLDGGEPDDGEHVGGEGAGLALGFREAPSPSFQRGAHARVPAGLIKRTNKPPTSHRGPSHIPCKSWF